MASANFLSLSHLPIRQKRVHALEEGRLHHVGLVEHEADLLVATAGPPQHDPQVLVKVLGRVLVVALDLEDGEPVTCGNKGFLLRANSDTVK